MQSTTNNMAWKTIVASPTEATNDRLTFGIGIELAGLDFARRIISLIFEEK